MARALTRIATLLLLVGLMAWAPAASAQGIAWWLGGVTGAGSTDPVPVAEPQAPVGPDYDAWSRAAEQAEATIAEFGTTSEDLEYLRNQLATWRERFLQAQTSNSPRIDTLREQIAALGTAPADGQTETEELATRRKELGEQLARAQAPGIAAEEAYRRADGLIRETDRILRTRQTDELLRFDPAPANPANWPGALAALSRFTVDLYADLRDGWDIASRRDGLVDGLPALLLALLIAAALLWKGPDWVNLLINRVQARLPQRWWGVVELPLSLGQVILPMAALIFLTGAIDTTGFLGPLAGPMATNGLLAAGVLYYTVLWISGHVFPASDRLAQVLVLPPERRAEGRLHLALFALVTGAAAILTAGFDVRSYGLAVQVVTFPVTVVTGLLLFRIGQLLRQSATLESAATEAPGFRPLLLSLLGKAAMVIGVVGPTLGAIGYVSLSDAMVRPAMVSLGLLAVVALLQRLIYDIYALVMRAEQDRAQDALIPVLISFALALAALPMLALIWGVRPAELWEFWTRFREGFRLGETRISPTDFVVFGVIFGIGYGVTKLLQGALKTTILPKTSLDPGGRNAIVAGVGYVGLVLAALAAITSTGLDLSSLAIVAGALSVGIGFGLQNIVSNFVSGIILLIERPVAEGDWIQVGTVQGWVRSISVRSTRIETFDRTYVIVPNADLISGQVTNWTGFNLTGRLIVPVGVAYGSDTRKVERVLREIAEAQPLVVLNPPPNVVLMGFGADSLNFEIRMILRDVNFSLSVRSEVNHQIAARFADEGIEIPFAQRDIWIRNPEALTGAAPARAAGPPPTAPPAPAKPRADETTEEPPGGEPA
jgi:potassium-dependent mechanosensitive channel